MVVRHDYNYSIGYFLPDIKELDTIIMNINIAVNSCSVC